MSEEKEFSAQEEEQFRKGFNDGFVLQKHSPELLIQILEGQSDSKRPFIEGLKAGSQHLKREQVKALLQRKDNDLELGLGR